jgi:hypothetical protein
MGAVSRSPRSVRYEAPGGSPSPHVHAEVAQETVLHGHGRFVQQDEGSGRAPALAGSGPRYASEPEPKPELQGIRTSHGPRCQKAYST